VIRPTLKRRGTPAKLSKRRELRALALEEEARRLLAEAAGEESEE
jgi:hypothetical protein